jgi:hypothetical protein
MGRPNTNASVLKELIKHLQTGVYSVEKLAELTGLRRLTIYEWFKIWHRKPDNIIYISHWTKGTVRGHCTAHYSLGFRGEDVPRPARQSKAVKNKKLRERLKRFREREKEAKLNARKVTDEGNRNLSC